MSALENSRRDAGACRPLAAAAIVLETALSGAQADFDSVGKSAPSGETAALNLRFAAAMALYQSGDWAHAFAALAALADAGHVPASRLALLMLRYGTGWFRTPFSATPEQVARWARQVLRAPPRGSGPAAPRAHTAAPAHNGPCPPPQRRDQSPERHRKAAACDRAGIELDTLWTPPAGRQPVCG